MPAKKQRASAGGEANQSTKDRAYLLCRWWPYFNPHFPFKRFDDVPDTRMRAELDALTRESAAKLATELAKRREEKAHVSNLRQAGQPHNPERRVEPPRIAKSLDERPASFLEVCDIVAWTQRPHVLITDANAPWQGPFPTRTFVFHAALNLQRARAMLDALRERCRPPHGQYCFRIEVKARIVQSRWIDLERQVQILRSEQRPPQGHSKTPELTKLGRPFHQSSGGIPVWVLDLRDEADAVARLLDLEPESTGSVKRRALAATRKKPAGRPRSSDPNADRRVSEAWKTRQYRTYADLAKARGMAVHEVKAACERERKRADRLRTPSDK